MSILRGNAVVGQSGGPTAAINATLAGVIKGALKAQKDGVIKTLYGMRNGVEGFLKEDLVDLTLEDGDIEEGLNVASKIGDDYLQKQAQGYTVPDAFNHGTSAQRVRWLRKGLNSGDVNGGDTFSPAYGDL